ncbi:oxidoreductase [Halobacteriales archaeon QS_8_65_32]|nr:MAG: oxidoreductase [Halobacteriales archaeon QS_8_65_32]
MSVAGSKTVLITGCSSGIGRASARAFLEDEWRVYATARDEDDLGGLVDAGCETASLDVTNDEAVNEVVSRVVEEAGRLDCLVNNAGYGQFGPIEDVPAERVHEQFEVNVYGPHRLTRAVLPYMRDRGRGRIINVSSAAGRVSTPGMGIYNGSKFALEGMTDALRPEVEEYGIDVVLIEPGPVDSAFDERAAAELDGLEPSGAYDTYYELYRDTRSLGPDSPVAVSPRVVADSILTAANVPNPASRYQVGSVARASEVGRFVPDRMRDKAYKLGSNVLR